MSPGRSRLAPIGAVLAAAGDGDGGGGGDDDDALAADQVRLGLRALANLMFHSLSSKEGWKLLPLVHSLLQRQQSAPNLSAMLLLVGGRVASLLHGSLRRSLPEKGAPFWLNLRHFLLSFDSLVVRTHLIWEAQLDDDDDADADGDEPLARSLDRSTHPKRTAELLADLSEGSGGGRRTRASSTTSSVYGSSSTYESLADAPAVDAAPLGAHAAAHVLGALINLLAPLNVPFRRGSRQAVPWGAAAAAASPPRG